MQRITSAFEYDSFPEAVFHHPSNTEVAKVVVYAQLPQEVEHQGRRFVHADCEGFSLGGRVVAAYLCRDTGDLVLADLDGRVGQVMWED